MENGGDVQGHPDLVADERVPAAERLVELHVEVAALELADDLQAGARVAPRIGVGALDEHLERDLTGDAVHREVAGNARGLVVDRLDVRGLERDLGELLGVEEVRRAKVVVALRLVGVD